MLVRLPVLWRVVLLAGALLMVGCTGLSGEPRVVATIPPVPTRVPVTDPLAQGEAIFAERCASCHGIGGRGDGELVTSGQLASVPDMTARSADVTLDDYYTIITEGRIENMMPPWEGALTEAERRAVAAYAYSLATSGAPLTEETTPVPAALETITVEGVLENGTAGASVPDDLVLTLYVLTMAGETVATEEGVSAGGEYRFEGVTFRPDYAYLVSVDYAGTTFISGLGVPSDLSAETPSLALPVTVYEVTDDPSVLSVSLLLHQVMGLDEAGGSAMLTVMRFDNTSDRVYLPSGAPLDDGRARVLEIPLLPGAVPTGLDQNRYVWDEQANLIVDTLPVLPGAGHLVHVPVALPPADRWELRYQLPYPVTNQPELMLAPDQFTVESAQFESQGVMQFTGGVFEDFLAEPVGANQPIAFTLMPRGADSQNPQILIGIGLIGMGVLSLGAAGVLALRQRSRPSVSDEALVAQIAALDLAHQRGEIDETVYQRQREALKRQLARRMKG
ncbi:MAG: c-type cytochrome [Anaerolineae bacterium]|nr:c-type cytochrome [Anaerolineae bacterium]